MCLEEGPQFTQVLIHPEGPETLPNPHTIAIFLAFLPLRVQVRFGGPRNARIQLWFFHPVLTKRTKANGPEPKVTFQAEFCPCQITEAGNFRNQSLTPSHTPTTVQLYRTPVRRKRECN